MTTNKRQNKSQPATCNLQLQHFDNTDVKKTPTSIMQSRRLGRSNLIWLQPQTRKAVTIGIMVVLLNNIFHSTIPSNHITTIPKWRGHITSHLQANLRDPHRGARHPNGTEGMIVNPAVSRLSSFDHIAPNTNTALAGVIEQDVICPPQSGFGIEGKGGNKVLQRIREGIRTSQRFLQSQERAIRAIRKKSAIKVNGASNVGTETVTIEGNNSARAKKSKILCMVYTVHFPPDFNNHNLRAQANTWAKMCDGFFAASNYTDHTVGAIDLIHEGDEAYANMWQKTRSMLSYAYDNYRDEYDFYYMGGDDLYVAIDNLRAYVDSNEVIQLENGLIDVISKHYESSILDPLKRPRPLVLGTRMMRKQCTFPAGGSGYTLNRAALDIFVEQGIPSFLPNARDSREDVLLGSWFCSAGVYVSYTNDENNGERYWGSAESSSNFNGVSPVGPKQLKHLFNTTIPLGGNSASSQQIGFHLKDDKQMLKKQGRTIAEQMYRYHAILFDWCDQIHDQNEAVSNLTSTSISTTSTEKPTSTERTLVQVYESLNDKTRFQEALNSSLPPTIYSCNVQGNGEFQNIIHTILPEYKLDDQKLKTGPRGYEWHGNLIHLESTQYDIFLNTYQMSCSHAATTWLMRKFKGQYIFVTGESIHNAIYEKENDFIDPRMHTFAHVPETPRDQTLTYLQVSWMFFFRDVLPLPAMLDRKGSTKPKGNRTHFLVYGQSNCVGFRNEAFGKLSTIAPVHQSGKCGANGIKDHSNVTKVDSGINIHNWRNNINHYAEYRFCLVMEHADPVEHPDYVTEKVMMAFVAGCIPIYYGPDMIFDIFNDKAFVFYNISDPQPALDQVRKMEFDRDEYERMALQPILKNGNETVEKYFSFSDDIENGALKRRFREKLHLP